MSGSCVGFEINKFLIGKKKEGNIVMMEVCLFSGLYV